MNVAWVSTRMVDAALSPAERGKFEDLSAFTLGVIRQSTVTYHNLETDECIVRVVYE